jgi:translation initiation factor 2D
LYKPNQELAPLFDASSASPHTYYSAVDIKSIVSKYIEREQLNNEKNRRLVDLDPVLANALFDAGKEQDAAMLQRGSVQRDVLVERVLGACAPWHVIVRNPDSGFNEGAFGGAKPKAGLPPKVLVTLGTRSGNKTVTKISGLEAFHVSPQPLADELRKVCAGSTSVDQLVGSSKSKPVMEVMVQGPQKDAVIKALERRGLERTWVEIVDKTKGKKK